jgi:23S rRNA pseudouridine2605 synthase
MLSMDANAKKDNGLERLQKIMASSGVASRRKCEEMIKAGRVTVNGKVITELGFKASYSDEIRVDGSQIASEDKVYYVMNKPTGYLTTVSDDRGRRTVMDIFEDYDRQNRIFPIGRLDYDSSGCLLFTNDGELAAKLTKSSNNIEKEYVVRVKGRLEQKDLVKIRRGI